MALIKCPECGHMVSPNALACPSCGEPIAKKNTTTASAPKRSAGMDSGTETFSNTEGNRISLQAATNAKVKAVTAQLSAQGKMVVSVTTSNPQPITVGVTTWTNNTTIVWQANWDSPVYQKFLYSEAVAFQDKGYYTKAIERYEKLGDYEDSISRIQTCKNRIQNYKEASEEIKEKMGKSPNASGGSMTLMVLGFLMAIIGGAMWIGIAIVRSSSYSYNGIQEGPWIAATLIGLAIVVIHFVRASNYNAEVNALAEKKRKQAEGEWTEEDALDDLQQACELCGMKVDKLIPVTINDRLGTRTRKVCEDCYKANSCQRLDKEPHDSKSVQAEDKIEKSNKNTFLLNESKDGHDTRIAKLLKKRRGNSLLQEDLFLEDVEKEKSIRQIYGLWESYEFDEEYPEIDAILLQLKDKEKANGVSTSTLARLKEELKALFNCEDVGILSERDTEDNESQLTQSRDALYCENCGNIYYTQQCPRCGSNKGRSPKPNDACFLAEVSGLESNILEDALKQNNIPFAKKGTKGAGITMTVGSMNEMYKFSVPYKHYMKAQEVLLDVIVAE